MTPETYLPTPDQIRAAAAQLRSEWTERTRQQRLGLKVNGMPQEARKILRSVHVSNDVEGGDR